MPRIPEGRRHDAAGGMVPILMEILALIQCQVLDQRLTPNPLALHPRPANGFMRLFAGRMHDVQWHARHVGNHDCAVRGFPFDLRRPRIGVSLRSCIAFGQQLGGHLCHHIAVLGMHHGDAAQFRQTVERGKKLVIIHHQRALIGEEVFERVDPARVDHGFHVVEDLLAPPCHRHMEGIVAICAGRLIVPALDRVQQAFALIGQAEIHHHRGAAGQARARAAFEIIAGIGAHEGHFQMHMRINPARHHVTACGVQLLVA